MVTAATRPPAPSRQEYARRTASLRQLLAEQRLDGGIVFASTMRPGPLLYHSGYAPTNGFACLYVTDTSATLLTDQPWDVDAARRELWPGDAVMATEDMGADLADLTSGAERIGVAGWELLPTPTADTIRGGAPENSPRGTRLELRGIGAEAAALRTIKSDEEIALLREACAITSAGAATLAAEARAGTSERALAAKIEAAMRTAGSGPLAFPLVLGSGATQTASAVPLPGDRVLEDGDMVLLDCGATYLGYCGDMARTLVVGAPRSEQRRLLDTALVIFERCAEMLNPGTRAAEIHGVATSVAADAGLELPFLLGHGIGCQNWEPPLLGAADQTTLEPGMVLTLEPGLYVPDVGGVRLENTFLITHNGAESLTSGPIDLWR